jgi:tyrosyl-tRNA synthetase
MTAKDSVPFLDLFTELQLATSKKEERQLIQGGRTSLEGEMIKDENESLTAVNFNGKTEVALQAGKKWWNCVSSR